MFAGFRYSKFSTRCAPSKLPGAEIARQKGGPSAAQHAAGIAHRVLAVVAGPVRHGRAVDHDRADEVGLEGADEHGGPAALAVADHDRLAGIRMALADDAQKLRLGARDIREGLARQRIREEDHEVDRMPGLQRHADLRVLLEAADARAHDRPSDR